MSLEVGVIRGGMGSGYDESLASGAAMLEALRDVAGEREWRVHDIFIDRSGSWHRGGLVRSPERALRMLDVALTMLHGEGGEDGELARTLERFGVAHGATSASSASAIADRERARYIARQAGARTPHAYVVRAADSVRGDDALEAELFQDAFARALVRPKGVSLVTPVYASDASSLEIAIRQALLFSPATAVLVEEYVDGERIEVGAIEQFRGEALYLLPAASVAADGTILCPSRSRRAHKQEAADLSRTLFGAFGLRGYALFAYALSPRGAVFLDVRTLPTLHADSSFVRALEAIGASLPEFGAHLVSLALSARRR